MARIAYSYTRFSSGSQRFGDSQKRQDTDVQGYCREHYLKLDQTLTFRDAGLSAYTAKHKAQGALGKFLVAVESGLVKSGSVLVVEAIDRITRENFLDAFKTVTAILHAGVEVHTVEDGEVYTADNLDGGKGVKLAERIAAAHSFSKRLSGRVGAAWRRKKEGTATGKVLSRMCPAWLRVSDDGSTYQVIEERARVVRRIFSDYGQGLGTLVIAKRLTADGVPTFSRAGQGMSSARSPHDAWHPSYITKLINNRSVLGEYQPCMKNASTHGRRVEVGTPVMLYPPIVDNVLFTMAKERTTKSVAGRKGPTFANLLTGICRCLTCESTMTLQNRGKRWATSREYKALECSMAKRGGQCSNKKLYPYAPLEAAVLDLVEQYGALDASVFIEPDDAAPILQAAAKVRNDIERDEATIKNLLVSFADAPSSRVASFVAELEVKIEGSRRHLGVLEDAIKAATDDARVTAAARINDRRRVATDDGGDPQRRYVARASINAALREIIDTVCCIEADQSTDSKPFFLVVFAANTFVARVELDGAVGALRPLVGEGRLQGARGSMGSGVKAWLDRGDRLQQRILGNLRARTSRPS